MKTDVPLQLRYGGIVLMILGPVLALFAAGLYLQSRRAQSWPTVEARVTKSKVEVSKKASGFRRSRTSFQDYYTAAIQYEYVVDGERFTGDRIGLDESRSSGFDRDDAQRWVRQYPVGAAVTIHYCPHRAQQSVIDPSSDTTLLALVVGFGILAIPAGLVMRRIARQMQPVQPLAAPVPRRSAAPVPPRAAPAPSPVAAFALPPAVAPAGRPALMTQTRLEEPRTTHWLIRTVVVLTGLVLLCFGSLTFPVSVNLYLRAGNAPGQTAISIAAHLVTIGMMGGVTLLGAFLVWRGIKRTGRPRRLGDCTAEAA